MHKPFLLLTTVMLMSVCMAVWSVDEQPVVGVVEFEEKTGIGQENAGIVIPELLITHLKQIGRYKLAERILLHEALSEQELQMAGVVDKQTAVKVGQIYGIGAFISGSAMRVGKGIIISGRIISAETGEIIDSGTVMLTNIRRLDQKLEELAYYLSGYSEREYRKTMFEQAVSKNQFGVRGGAGYSHDRNVNTGQFIMRGSLFFHSRWLDAEFGGVGALPSGDIGNTAAFMNFYPFLNLGIGAGWTWMVYDSPSKIGEEKYDYQYHGLLFGLSYRITKQLTMAMYQSIVLAGSMRFDQDYQTGAGDAMYPLQTKLFFFSGGASLLSVFEAKLTDSLSFRYVFEWNSVMADSAEFIRSHDMRITLEAGYRFSF